MRFWSTLIVVVSVTGLPGSAHAICSTLVLCKIDQAGNKHCETFRNVCKEAPPEKKYSMELKDLSLEDVQKISDLLDLHLDASKLDNNQ
jgi:hypothetical protein